ncbi:MAG: hypothetical protein NVS2B16_06370 [Chloroflexota bacterium]
MRRNAAFVIVVAMIAAFVGVAGAAAAFAWIPSPGSGPSIYDDFNWVSTANGFWHLNGAGADATIKHSILTLRGNSLELDRRVQTDPTETVVSARVRGLGFHKFGLGLGVWHAGTIGMEFDDDGVKCGRASDYGYQVDFLKAWSRPPIGKWLYLEMKVRNPYPDPTKIPKVDDKLLKRVQLTCSIYDDTGKLIATDRATNPPPNTHYVGLDEAYLRVWDNQNRYQVDWYYAGPPKGNPLNGIVKGTHP